MAQENRIYILMIRVNKLFSFFVTEFCKRNRKHVLHVSMSFSIILHVAFNHKMLLADGLQFYDKKQARQCFTTFPDTLKFVKNTLLNMIFSIFFLMFGNVVKLNILPLLERLVKSWPSNMIEAW